MNGEEPEPIRQRRESTYRLASGLKTAEGDGEEALTPEDLLDHVARAINGEDGEGEGTLRRRAASAPARA